MKNSYNEYTALKTKAGRLRHKDKKRMEELLKEWGYTSIDFVPTTYKPTGTEFVEPTVFDWMQGKGNPERY
jgi:hypothetical protein